MKRLSKKLRIGRSKTKLYSLETEKVKDAKLLRPLSVILKEVRKKSDSESWIKEDSRQEIEAVSLSGDETDWKQTIELDTNNNNDVYSYSHFEEDDTSSTQGEDGQWTKDVIFEAEQLALKAELEKLRCKTNVENSRNINYKESMNRWSSMPAISQIDRKENTHSTTQLSSPKNSTRRISKKQHRYPSKSLESIPRCLGSTKMRKSRSNRKLELNEEGSMALLRAARNDSVLQASSLIRHGISTEIIDQRGWTPLCIALERGNIKCAEVLVRWNANVDFKHENGKSILHHVTALGLYKGIRFLLGHGVDVNVEDNEGWPAVHYGLQGRYLQCAAMLLTGGCDVERYTKARVDEFQSVVKIATIGRWKYIWQSKLGIDLDNQVDL